MQRDLTLLTLEEELEQRRRVAAAVAISKQLLELHDACCKATRGDIEAMEFLRSQACPKGSSNSPVFVIGHKDIELLFPYPERRVGE